MKITIYRGIGKEEAISLITKKEKSRKKNESDKIFFTRILPTLKGKKYDFSR